MKHKVTRITIFVLAVFGALTTIAGGIGLMTGLIQTPPEWLQGSPFVDYTVPGLALAIIVGGSMLFAAATILTGREIGALASVFAGLAMIIFEIVEIAIVDRIAGSSLLLAASLQAFYIVLGLAIVGLASALWMREYRSHHFSARHVSHA